MNIYPFIPRISQILERAQQNSKPVIKRVTRVAQSVIEYSVERITALRAQFNKQITATSVIAGLVIGYNVLLPAPTFSDTDLTDIDTPIEQALAVGAEPTPDEPRKVGLPEVQNVTPQVVKTYTARTTYYASEKAQTDGDPFTTASGTRVHWGTVAANCLPFGTKIRMPDVYGDMIFIVEDRHAKRFGCGLMDVWTDYSPGQNPKTVNNVKVEVLETIPGL
jgi:hypothetical protein